MATLGAQYLERHHRAGNCNDPERADWGAFVTYEISNTHQ